MAPKITCDVDNICEKVEIARVVNGKEADTELVGTGRMSTWNKEEDVYKDC